ncbi:hypothetical protein K470DRAFT_177128 [Piedraia hortae CBS 480.64]|uniref:Uncharacterized protein n=1 Tax=Piedraia hortae CBS 480.64 TaxID=1314780 RepID=A0A6A7BPV7_9PEZI|nr:hypothetical protein K470DRAFT_177128 [Piedraia hortae CBS 480.64]
MKRLSGALKRNRNEEISPFSPSSDSAYASSDGPSLRDSKRSSEMVPVSSNNDNRNLAMNPSTGEVVDEDTGELVTVTTTTVTTTTTTRPGKKNTTSHGQGAAEQPRVQSVASSRNEPQTPVTTQQQTITAPENQNANFNSQGTSVTPTHGQNFSYPRRQVEGTDQEATKPKGAMANLKAAAMGIHGVGETLRGTINSEMDSRFAGRNPAKAEAARTRNAAVLQRGEQEMASVYHPGGMQNAYPQAQGQMMPTQTNMFPHQGTTMQPQGHIPENPYGPDPTAPQFHGQNTMMPAGNQMMGNQMPMAGQGGMGSIPEQNEYGYAQGQGHGESGLKKLLKRRPVGS